jgi:3D (Asp-Asp-Asp) domain-containing protein
MRPYNLIVGCIAAAAFCFVSIGEAQIGDPKPAQDPVVVKSEVTELPYKVEYQFDRSLGPGRMEKVRNGVDGFIQKTVQYTQRNGKLVEPKLIGTERVEPVSAVINIGQAGWETTRGSYERVKIMNMQSTGYTRFENTNRTALGLPAKFGVVAVDRRVIKLGTRLYVEGYGYAIAGDTGGAIKGNRIDLCFDEYNQAIRWGRRPVRVHILK